MKNHEIAYILYEIANMLEIKGENFFKIRAYRNAAHEIENLAIDIQKLVNQNALKEIDGVGEAISGKIYEILEKGTCRYYEELKAEVPRGLVDMLKIPGLGAKRIKVIYDNLKIASIEELEKAANSKQLQTLPGIGVKTEQSIIRGIQMIKGRAGRYLLSTALSIAQDMVTRLSSLPSVEKAQIAGSLRRKKEMVGDIDLLVVSNSHQQVTESFLKFPEIREVITKGSTKTSVILELGIQVDLRVVKPESFSAALLHFTGSKEHNTKLRSLALRKGLRLNEYGIINLDDGEIIYPQSEKEIYKELGMPYIIPEIREDTGEVEAAMKDSLPNSVNLKDIKGDLHVHSNWSDGVSSIEEIALYAKKLGYEYIAITDHSKSLKIARGLDEEKLKRQLELIYELNKKIDGIKILSGIEVDILSNNLLDFNDDILEQLDVVVASIHTGFKQERDKITGRIIMACENPNVDIIAHPTGRLLGRRAPYDVDMELVLQACAQTNTILEINSSPDRLDINDKLARKAKALGLKMSINTDAHVAERLNDIKYGVWVARRGWLEKDDVINTLPFECLLKELNSK